MFAKLSVALALATAPAVVADTWDKYEQGGMSVMSVVAGDDESYEKVAIFLHGGGSSGAEYYKPYTQGWFGNTTGIKLVFPTSPLDYNVWYNSYKIAECGLADDCAYDIPSIETSAEAVAELIAYETSLVGGDNSKVYLAGFSEGAQLTGYMQLAKLDYALAGVVVMDGFPLPPLNDMVGADHDAAKANATYYGQDMNWMIWWGSRDTIFPPEESLDQWNAIFDVLDIGDTLAIEHTEPEQTHTLIEKELNAVGDFIRAD